MPDALRPPVEMSPDDRAGLLAALERIVGPSHVLTDPELQASYTTDWTGRFVGSTRAVVRPASTAEVSEVLRLCADAGVPVTPQGGNTGLVGGGVPLRDEILMSLRRLDALGDVDTDAAQVSCGAGATIARVRDAAQRAGWDYGVDIASRDSATVGGTVATNAGGMHVMRWGATRAQVVGIEAVLADGRVLSHMGGLIKDNTGFDLAGLMCGSEGTLGVITAVRLRLVPRMEHRTVALVGIDDVGSAVGLVTRVRRDVPELDTAEIMFAQGLDLVREHGGPGVPLERRWPVYLLLGASAQRDPTDDLGAAIASWGGLSDVAVATDPAGRRALVALRELHTPAINSLGVPLKLDVGLPATSIAEFARQVVSDVAHVDPSASVWLFGHVGDGNIHVNITGWSVEATRLDKAVLGLTASLGGSISAEHGIGVAKKRWLGLNRSEAEIDVFRSIKAAMDPSGILNPNVLLP